MPLCPEEMPDWTEKDHGALRNFLYNQDTGRKLVLLLRYQEQTINATTITLPDRCEYNCGWAAGFRAAVAILQSLSANVPPHPDDDSENPAGAEDFAERHAP
jgi:hypothetical protein